MTSNLPVQRSANPIATRRDTPDYDPLDRLRDHVAKCNSYRWVVDSGKLFFVNQRERADGTIEHFVDRAA